MWETNDQKPVRTRRAVHTLAQSRRLAPDKGERAPTRSAWRDAIVVTHSGRRSYLVRTS